MDEMVGDTMDMMDDEEGLEDEADEQVDKVLWEITDGKLGQAGKAGQAELPVSVPAPANPRPTR
jgi:charged multivesicular body protein 3